MGVDESLLGCQFLVKGCERSFGSVFFCECAPLGVGLCNGIRDLDGFFGIRIFCGDGDDVGFPDGGRDDVLFHAEDGFGVIFFFNSKKGGGGS